jgi:hypothetical protein
MARSAAANLQGVGDLRLVDVTVGRRRHLYAA